MNKRYIGLLVILLGIGFTAPPAAAGKLYTWRPGEETTRAQPSPWRLVLDMGGVVSSMFVQEVIQANGLVFGLALQNDTSGGDPG